ncbi:MAG: polysaccharide biosynthesis protein PslH [Solirubrobacteraceae bacterium]|nr:polysaccharide biosynthesis protein PslH [Solirubrobacteraceae bacterium]
MARRRHPVLHFTGAGVAKLAPPFVQFVLLLLVARAGSLDDVGRLALASAAAFLCGALAELGLATSLSIPKVTFATDGAPLRATRRLRLTAALLGCVLYVALWAAGLGGHDPVLLLVAPLPFALALAYGYAGAMNASGELHYEIPISLGESVLVLAIALLGALAIPALTAALAALLIGRFAGLVARMVVIRRLPQSDVEHLPGVVRAQLPFALATVAFVIQGQADILAVGFFSALAVAAVYAPLLRTAYSTLLSAEALSWSLFGGANPDEHAGSGRLGRSWRPLTMVLGVVVAIVFVLLAQPFLHLLLDRPVPNLTGAVLLFGAVIVTRFGALMLHVDVLRAGRQRDEIPVLFASAAVLAVFGIIAASADSLTGLAGARLASELLIAAGFVVIRRRGPARALTAPEPEKPERPESLDRSEQLRLLVLAPFPPRLDAHGGARVIAQLVARLADEMRVTVLCLRHSSDAQADDDLRGRLERLEEVPRPDVDAPGARTLRFVRWRAAALLRGRPFWGSDLRVRAYRERLDELIRSFRPDVVQIEYTAMAQYLPDLAASAASRVLVEHDPEAGAPAAAGALGRRLDAQAWRRLRRRAVRAVDAVVVFTQRDRAVLAPAAAPTPVVAIPFGAGSLEGDPRPAESDGSVLFVGNFVHAPNADAARRLVTSIFPRVRNTHPDCVLYVVGDNPPPELVEDERPGVVVTGWVADLSPLLQRAAVVVAPLREGGGMRVKVVDALAAGKAVVATPRGAEGLAVADGDQLRLATTDEDFAARISELLDDGNARKRLEERARAWAQENLTWDASVRAYEALYRRLLDGRRSGRKVEAEPASAPRG